MSSSIAKLYQSKRISLIASFTQVNNWSVLELEMSSVMERIEVIIIRKKITHMHTHAHIHVISGSKIILTNTDLFQAVVNGKKMLLVL